MRPAFSKDERNLAEHRARYGKVFSSAQRVLILWLLADSEKTVSEIAIAIGASLPRTSQHLQLMKLSNIIVSYRQQKNIYYRIADNELIQKLPILFDRTK